MDPRIMISVVLIVVLGTAYSAGIIFGARLKELELKKAEVPQEYAYLWNVGYTHKNGRQGTMDGFTTVKGKRIGIEDLDKLRESLKQENDWDQAVFTYLVLL